MNSFGSTSWASGEVVIFQPASTSGCLPWLRWSVTIALYVTYTHTLKSTTLVQYGTHNPRIAWREGKKEGTPRSGNCPVKRVGWKDCQPGRSLSKNCNDYDPGRRKPTRRNCEFSHESSCIRLNKKILTPFLPI